LGPSLPLHAEKEQLSAEGKVNKVSGSKISHLWHFILITSAFGKV